MHLFPSWQPGRCGRSWWGGWTTGSVEDSGPTRKPSLYAGHSVDRQAHPRSLPGTPAARSHGLPVREGGTWVRLGTALALLEGGEVNHPHWGL